MTGPSQLPAGLYRSCDLNSILEKYCVCSSCGEVMLTQRRVGDSHRRDDHQSLDVDFPTFRPVVLP
jgi:hypothetical protein